MAKSGSLSINSENIFPIIKKWLYSDHDIFYRELVSNGCDAITKLKKLALMGEYETPDDDLGTHNECLLNVLVHDQVNVSLTVTGICVCKSVVLLRKDL